MSGDNYEAAIQHVSQTKHSRTPVYKGKHG